MPFVVDASVTLPWCFKDEVTPWTEGLLNRVIAGETAILPALWLIEVSNALLMAVRRKRIEQLVAEQFLEKLASLNLSIEPALSTAQARAVLLLGIQHNLTFYDAVYLELAQRKLIPLATLDGALIRAAKDAGVALVP